MKTVSVIGHGRIGSALVRGIAAMEGRELGPVLTRTPVPGLARNTVDAEAFLARPADLIVEAAGPDALRALGPGALARAPVWSVGAVAMADVAFRDTIAEVAHQTGHSLRLFACGMANMPLSPERLSITMRWPGFGDTWSGLLSDAVARWPEHLNTAVTAALNGPGLDATRLTFEDSGPGGGHEIRLEAKAGGMDWSRSVRFADRDADPHPVAQMILTELGRSALPWQGT